MKTLDVGSVLAQGQQVINGYKSASVDLGELLGVARTADANVAGAIQEQGAATQSKKKRLSRSVWLRRMLNCDRFVSRLAFSARQESMRR
jgi:hypothetical protein